ncbi:DgyrCDS4162 [Dimorphilus gyrociliatus]|uniref:DgyrCDS4162 n=1 Tax=Dimorphilus gyrociliatus TaxID=2664684 RepID=A0A7I8VIR9_9ANNE|nr:DgyrCDS4162 [Dimorphilus gyrociliatus]
MRKTRAYKRISFFDLCLIGILIGVIFVFLIFQKPQGPNIREEIVRKVFSKGYFGVKELSGSQTTNTATEINLGGISQESSLNNEREKEKETEQSINKINSRNGDNIKKRLSPFGEQGNLTRPDELIYERLNKLNDTRPKICKDETGNDDKHKESATIVILFRDNEWFDVKMTILSILKFTDVNYIKEILLLDGSDVTREIGYFLKICPKCVSLKCNKDQFWTCRETVQERGTVLVFLSPRTTVLKGWLLPLLRTVQSSPESVVIPHTNVISDIISMNIKKIDPAAYLYVTLRLNIRYVTSRGDDSELTAPSLALNMNCFALKPTLWRRLSNVNRKSYVTEIAKAVDLSIKSWICAKGIIKAKCSHIATHFTRNLWKQTNPNDIKTLVESYLTPINYHGRFINLTDREAFSTHLKNLQTGTNKLDESCQGIETFFKSKDHRNPYLKVTNDVYKYGVMRVENGQCVNTKRGLNRLDVGGCPYKFENPSQDKLFHFSSDNRILHKEKCLSADDFYVVVKPCSSNDKNQLWSHTNENHIIHKSTNSCMVHVTDPMTNGRQIVMIQSCRNDPNGLFSKWSFLDF